MTAPTITEYQPTYQPTQGWEDPTPPKMGVHVGAVVLAGLSAGFFFAYEASVIRGLAEVDDLTYVHTFQAINATIRNPMFGIVFFGSLPALVLARLLHRGTARSPKRLLLTIAPVLYLVGMGITFTGNVVLNDELADVEPSTAAIAATARADFEDDWNRLDGYRSIAFLGAFAAAAAALPLADRAGRK